MGGVGIHGQVGFTEGHVADFDGVAARFVVAYGVGHQFADAFQFLGLARHVLPGSFGVFGVGAVHGHGDGQAVDVAHLTDDVLFFLVDFVVGGA